MKSINLYEVELVYYPSQGRSITGYIVTTHVAARNASSALSKALKFRPSGLRADSHWKTTGKYKLLGKVIV